MINMHRSGHSCLFDLERREHSFSSLPSCFSGACLDGRVIKELPMTARCLSPLGPALLAEWCKVLLPTIRCLSPLRPALIAECFKMVSLTARCLSPLRPALTAECLKVLSLRPDLIAECCKVLSLTARSRSPLRPALIADCCKVLPLTARCLSPLSFCLSVYLSISLSVHPIHISINPSNHLSILPYYLTHHLHVPGYLVLL